MSRDLPPLPHDEAIVKAALQARIRSVIAELGYSVKDLKNGVIMPLNPRRKDKSPGSFVIWVDRGSAGAFKDYSSGEKGDVFDLVQFTLRLDRWIDAYWWSLNFLGWGRHEVRTASQVKQDREDAERERKASLAREKADQASKAARQRAFWLKECAPDWTAPSPIWTYLTQARELPMGQMAHLPGAIRWNADVEHYDKDTGEVTSWPCMTTAMSGPDGQVTAVHYTWLKLDGSDKAPVDKPKKMRGVAKGAAIRLSKGETGLTPEEAARRGVAGPLIITEGIEDALTAALARPSDRCWAAGSLSLLGELVWPGCASSVVLVADNDWLKPAAISAFEAVEAKWRAMAEGRPLKVVRAAVGKDLNDWARGRA